MLNKRNTLCKKEFFHTVFDRVEKRKIEWAYMKNKVLVLSHDKLAGALVRTTEFIYGELEDLCFIDMPDPFDIEAYEKSIRLFIEENESVLVLCDLNGGSPFLTCMKIMRDHWENCEVLSGVNMPMLLEVAGNMDSLDLKELKALAVEAGKEGIVDIKERMARQ